MNSDHRDIHRYLRELAQRERGLLVLNMGLRTACILAASLAWVSLAAFSGLQRSEASGLLVLWIGLGTWWGVARPLWTGWRSLHDPMRQARLVESREPRLEGRLVATADRPDGARTGESKAIVALAATRAKRVLGAHRPTEVHPVEPLRRLAGGTLGLWLAVGLFAGIRPGGPGATVGWWWADALAAGKVAQGLSEGSAAAARVGDISLRYVYPDYTGLEPYVVANSTGEAHAPPGTRVHVVARSDQAVVSAALVAYDEPALDAKVVEGRQIEASFVVQGQEGTYELVTYVEGEARTSPAFQIVPEPDLPPEVSLVDVPAVMEVPVDQFLGLMWTARDDYGVAMVSLEISGRVREPPMRKPRDRRADVTGRVDYRPTDLGMVPGQTYEVRVVAWDNDTWSGSKAGRSQLVRIVVLDEDGVARLTPERRRELRNLLVDALADNLEEPFPPGRAAGDYARWGESVSARYDQVATFLDAFRSRLGGIDADLRTSELALEAVRTLVRYSQVSFLPGSRDVANAGSVEAVVEFRDEAVMLTEDAVLDLDQLIAAAAFREVASSADDLSWEAQELARRIAGEDVDAISLLVEIEAIDDLLKTVSEHADDLRDGGLKRFVAARAEENTRLSEAVSSALGIDDRPRARQMAERLRQRLDEMAAGIREELERLKEESKKGQSEAKDLVEELEEIIAVQDGLADGLASQAAEAGEARVEMLQSGWEAARAKALEVDKAMDALAEALRQSERPFNEQEFVAWAKVESSAVVDAINFRDLPGALLSSDELERLWQRYALRFEQLYLGRAEAVSGPGRDEIRRRQTMIVDLQERLEQLRRADETTDPALRDLSRRQRSGQRALLDRLDMASRDAKRVAQEFPVTPRGLEESLEQAGERMEQADGQLGRGDALQAEGSQRAASLHVREAVEALRQAMQAAQRQQQEMSGGGGGEEGEDQQGGNAGETSEQEFGSFQLPEPEAFMTPEAYRRALLDGMAGNVPEEYRAMKRRYYEELVHQ